jgi:hypothetical protein
VEATVGAVKIIFYHFSNYHCPEKEEPVQRHLFLGDLCSKMAV